MVKSIIWPILHVRIPSCLRSGVVNEEQRVMTVRDLPPLWARLDWPVISARQVAAGLLIWVISRVGNNQGGEGTILSRMCIYKEQH